MLTRRQFLAAPLAMQQARKPNLVLIVSDDHHWQCIGAAGNPHVQTPNIDKLAARGVYFPQGVISIAQCAPSRGVLLSGLECYQTGLDSNGHISFRTFNGATVVEQLRRAGYATNLVGKWHIDNLPKQCGFTNAPRWLRTAASPYINPKLRHGLDATTDIETPGHITEIFTDAAIDVIKNARQPYLLWLTYNAPHTPWTASDKYRSSKPALPPPAHPAPRPAAQAAQKKKKQDGPFDWETYYAVIRELDANIGRVIDAVDWNNTLIVFIGDNGYLAGSKGLNGKVFPWEESVRIPFLVSGGLVGKPGKSDAPVASIDVPATLLDVAGVKPSHKMSGASMKPLLNGGKFARDAAYCAWNDGRTEALFAGYPVEPYRLVRTATHKFIVWESKKTALFDLRSDPHEEKNLADDPAQKAALTQMKNRIRARMKATADPAMAWLG